MAALCVVRSAPALAYADDGLRDICRAAVRTPAALRLGSEAAGRRHASAVEAALRVRLAPAAGREAWSEALCEAGRRDLAAGDTVALGGIQLTRSEAEMLALGARLAPFALA